MQKNNTNIDDESMESQNMSAGEDISEENTDTNTEAAADVDAEAAVTDSEDISETASEEESEGAEDTDDKEGGKKGLFKKKKDKKDELIEELTDKYKRTFAEFDNFRKRSEKEKSAMYEIGAKDIIEKILPVVDNFERGFDTISDEEKATPFAEGMDKIYQQLIKTLEEAGVKEIEAEGKEFDPNLHNAVMHVEDESLGENVVAEVLQKGYLYRDTVVRHSMVKVAN